MALTNALPQRWRQLGFQIDPHGRLVLDGEAFATATEEADRRRWLPLLGRDLGIQFSHKNDEWTAELAGTLLPEPTGLLPPTPQKDGSLRLAVPGSSIAVLGGRLRLHWTGADAAAHVTLDPAGRARLELTTSAEVELTLHIHIAGALEAATGADISVEVGQFALPLNTPGYLFSATTTLQADAGAFVLIEASDTSAQLSGAALQLLASARISIAEKVTLAAAQLGDLIKNATTGAGALHGDIRIALVDDALEITGLQATFEGSDKLVLGDGRVQLGQDLRVPPDRAFAHFVVQDHYGIFALAASPLTCIIAKGSTLALYFTTTGWRMEMSALDGAAATVYTPGGTKANLLDKPGDRFELDLVSNDAAPALAIATRDGLTLRAVAREKPVDVTGLRDVRVTGGTLLVRGGDWQLAVEAEASLPWFSGAKGRVAISGGRTADRTTFGASFQVSTSEGWTDPSGVITVRNSSVTATLDWLAPGWKLGGSVGGTLVLNRVPFAGDAEQWVGKIFDGVSVDFDRVALDDLLDASFTFRLRRPLRVSLWDVFGFDVTSMEMGLAGSVTLRGLLGFSFGEVRFRGTVPGLKLLLSARGVALQLTSSSSFEGTLTAPSGVRAQLQFKRERDESVDILSGEGSITTPVVPDVEAMIRVGRFRVGGSWRPTIAVNANALVNQPVFPGVVLKRVGLGFGIYQKLRNLEAANAEDAFKLLQSGNLPEPGKSASWTQDASVDFSLVIQGLFGATTAPAEETDYYVADIVIALDTRLRLAGYGMLWIFTSPADARTDEFRAHPYSRGMLLIDAAEPSLIAVYESVPGSRMSIERALGPASGALSGVLGAVRTRASLEARSDLFDLTLGPNTVDFSLGPFRARGSTLLGVRASSAGVYAIAATSLSADFSAGVHISMGMIQVGVQASAGFGIAATLFGGVVGRKLILAADVRAGAYARLTIYLEIRFVIKIRAGFVRITIRFSKRWTFRIELELAVAATMALGSGGAAFQGSAKATFAVMGISVRGVLPVNFGNDELVKEARVAMRRAKKAQLPGKTI